MAAASSFDYYERNRQKKRPRSTLFYISSPLASTIYLETGPSLPP